MLNASKIQRTEKEVITINTKDAVVTTWEKDKRRKVSDSNKQLFCSGCRMNHYNGRYAKQCWHLKGSRLKKREIYMSLHDTQPRKVVTLGCFITDYHGR